MSNYFLQDITVTRIQFFLRYRRYVNHLLTYLLIKFQTKTAAVNNRKVKTNGNMTKSMIV